MTMTGLGSGDERDMVGLLLEWPNRTVPGEMRLIERQARRSLRMWTEGLPCIGSKPTDREARDWIDGWSADLWITDTVRILDAAEVEPVWTAGPWTEPHLGSLFALVLQAALRGVMRETCPRRAQHRRDRSCLRCGHTVSAKCECWSCTRSRERGQR